MRTDKSVFSVIIMILFASTIWISSVSALSQQQTSLGVKITDPAKGEQVAIGKNLTLSGTSSYNATSNCVVFVIVDGVRPYQKTIPTGQAGAYDYSKWKYTFTPAYAGTIREGANRITAKLLCQAIPVNLTKFYSINVTGIVQYTIIRNNTALSSNSSSYLFHPTPVINHLSLPTNSNSSASSEENSKNSSGYCSYSDYKRNVKTCA
jgi:hypothetical protein